MRHIIKSIPNALTCCNLLCGCLAIIFALESNFTLAFWMIVTSAVFDFFDGFAARMLKAYSTIGADLDSLADTVSFGVAPAMIILSVLLDNSVGSGFCAAYCPYVALGIAAFSALRLAKFNNDTRQTEEFRGLPTPAMALFFASYALSYSHIMSPNSITLTVVTLMLVALFCGLMVSDITMFSFKFKSFGFHQNALRYFFAIFAVSAVIVLGYAAPAVIITAYIFVSLIRAKSTN